MLQRHWQDAQDYLIRSNKVFRYLGDFDHVKRNTQDLLRVEQELSNLEQSMQKPD